VTPLSIAAANAAAFSFPPPLDWLTARIAAATLSFSSGSDKAVLVLFLGFFGGHFFTFFLGGAEVSTEWLVDPFHFEDFAA